MIFPCSSENRSPLLFQHSTTFPCVSMALRLSIFSFTTLLLTSSKGCTGTSDVLHYYKRTATTTSGTEVPSSDQTLWNKEAYFPTAPKVLNAEQNASFAAFQVLRDFSHDQ